MKTKRDARVVVNGSRTEIEFTRSFALQLIQRLAMCLDDRTAPGLEMNYKSTRYFDGKPLESYMIFSVERE